MPTAFTDLSQIGAIVSTLFTDLSQIQHQTVDPWMLSLMSSQPCQSKNREYAVTPVFESTGLGSLRMLPVLQWFSNA